MAGTISGGSGTLSNGQSCTITGSSFGSTGPTIAVFDDFEKGTNGNDISTVAGSAAVNEWDAVQYPTYSTTQAHGGTKSARFDFGDAYNYGGDRHLSVDIPSATQVYLSCWMLVPTGSYVPGVNSGDGGNWKFIMITGSPWPECDYVPVILGDLPGDGTIVGPNPWYDTAGLNGTGYFPHTFAKNRWHRWEWHQVGSSSGGGRIQMWETNASQARRSIGLETGINTLQSGVTWDYVTFPGYGRIDGTAINYQDDIYIATGAGCLARVEIGNASTYANCTNLAVCTVTSWSASSIGFTVRSGSFSPTASVYLYVIDSNGDASVGYQATMGQSLSGGTPPTGTVTLSVR